MPAPEGMLHAAVYGSPVAHGRLKSLNLKSARALKGVVGIFTAADIPGQNQIGPIIPDEELLASTDLHFNGQPVALVVADDPEIARQAVRKIVAEIEELPAVTNPRDAFAAGSIIGSTRTFEIGEVDQAWESCDVIVEGTCDIAGQEHVYMESQRARCMMREGGGFRVEASTQSPYAGQRMIAQVLGIPQHEVEVDVLRLGGGFGGKEDQATPYACLAALACHKTGKPVELVLRRDEDLRMTGKRHPYMADFKLGLKSSGEIVAYEAKHFQNAGASADLSPAVLERTLFHATNSYRVPNARLFAASCRTNLPSNTAFRGFGGPQGMFVIESAMAKAALKLGMSREELQRINLLKKGDHFAYGQEVETDSLERSWQSMEEKFDPVGTRNRINKYNATNPTRKKGMALMPVCFGISFTSTFMNQAGALVHVYSDGSVALTSGGVEMGQGLTTNLRRVAARTFGIDDARVKVESTNTTRVSNMSPSAASATTLLNGNAVMVAVRNIRARLLDLAGKELGLTDKRLSIENERVTADGNPTELTWTKLIRAAYLNRVGLVGLRILRYT